MTLCLPQSAPSTKVARQVPGLSQSSLSRSAWLPEAESREPRAPDTQPERQKELTVRRSNASATPGVPDARKKPLHPLPAPRLPTRPSAERMNQIPREKRARSPRVPRRKKNVAKAHMHCRVRLTFSGKLKLRTHASLLPKSTWHRRTQGEGRQVINKGAGRGSTV